MGFKKSARKKKLQASDHYFFQNGVHLFLQKNFSNEDVKIQTATEE